MSQNYIVMKHHHFLFACILSILLPLAGFSQSKTNYQNPDFSALAKNEKTLAILPFNVTLNLRPKDKANMTPEELKQKEIQNGLAAQSAIEDYLLKKNNRKNYSVSFQDIQKTNMLLHKNGISIDSLAFMPPQKICKLLGVDGVISGSMISNKPLSTGAAVAVDVLVGFGGRTNSGKCTIAVRDGATGKLMWKYKKSLSRGLGSDVNTIIEAIMRKASRKFPY